MYANHVSVEINAHKPKYKDLGPGMLHCVDWYMVSNMSSSKALKIICTKVW
jgi:hypothetical protein